MANHPFFALYCLPVALVEAWVGKVVPVEKTSENWIEPAVVRMAEEPPERMTAAD